MKSMLISLVSLCSMVASAQDFSWTYHGSGCPENSIRQQVNPTNDQQELIFRDLVTYKNGSTKCHLKLSIPGKPGQSMALDTLQVSYNFWLTQNSFADFNFVSTVNGFRDADHGSAFAGGNYGAGQLPIFDHSEKQWTPCGQASDITIYIAVTLQSLTSQGDRMMIEKITLPKLISKSCQQ